MYTGLIALDENRAEQLARNGEPVVLVRHETSTDDIAAMSQVTAVVTITGKRTSHAAVVARQLGIACVVGAHDLRIDNDKQCIDIGTGTWLTVDADHGRIYPGRLDIHKQCPELLLKRLAEWRNKQYKRATV